ncbi:MAG: hypothetical protein AB7U81_10915 [Thiohalomonadaceae bacterium]
MAKEKIVSPMPFPHDRPACIVVPAGGERWAELFIVQVPGGVSHLHAEPYMNFLAERVAWMLRRTPDEDGAMAELRSSLKQAKLLKKEPRKSTPGLFCIDCIATNAIFLARIRATLGAFPMEVLHGDHSAVTVLLRTGISEWIAAFRDWAEETGGKGAARKASGAVPRRRSPARPGP